MPLLPHKLKRLINSYLSAFHKYLYLIFGLQSNSSIQPSPSNVDIACELFSLLESRKCRNVGLDRARVLLSSCGDVDALVHATNVDGFNVIQVAVMNDDYAFVRLLVEEGWDLNHGKCSLPLHLACKLGDAEMVGLLLGLGSSATVKSGMCHPMQHLPIQHVPSRFHFLETDIFHCDSNHEVPVTYALQHDHVNVVKLLVESNTTYSWRCRPQILHSACRHGAFNCVSYLTSVVQSNEINGIDEFGSTPILYAVPWGRRFVQVLEASGADMHAVNFRQQSALHVLLTEVRDPQNLYECAKFLLACGLEQDVNSVDVHGNTALHSAVDLVNRKSTEGMKWSDDITLATMNLLMINNCSPNTLNYSGISALHKLIMAFNYLVSNDPTGITIQPLPLRENYKIDFSVLRRSMELLLVNGACPNVTTSSGRTSLALLLACILDLDTAKMEELEPGFLDCLQLLCSHGAGPSCSLNTHAEIILCLTRYGHRCLLQHDDETRNAMSAFFQQILTVLLRHGLNSNYRSNEFQRGLDSRSGNILVELVRLAQHVRSPDHLVHIYDWVLTCLQCGANPDVEPYPSDHIICHSQSSIFLKAKNSQPVNQYMYQIQDLIQPLEGEGRAKQVLMLFYNSMGHTALYQCLKAASFMSRFDPDCSRMPSKTFLAVINRLGSKPRSLKQVARVAIYIALNRQLSDRVPSLPLPTALKSYLTDVES